MIDEQILAVILKELAMTCRRNSHIWSNLNGYFQRDRGSSVSLVIDFYVSFVEFVRISFRHANKPVFFFFFFCLSSNVP